MKTESNQQSYIPISYILRLSLQGVCIPLILYGVILGFANTLTFNIDSLIEGGLSGRHAAEEIARDLVLYILILLFDVFIFIRTLQRVRFALHTQRNHSSTREKPLPDIQLLHLFFVIYIQL